MQADAFSIISIAMGENIKVISSPLMVLTYDTIISSAVLSHTTTTVIFSYEEYL